MLSFLCAGHAVYDNFIFHEVASQAPVIRDLATRAPRDRSAAETAAASCPGLASRSRDGIRWDDLDFMAWLFQKPPLLYLLPLVLENTHVCLTQFVHPSVGQAAVLEVTMMLRTKCRTPARNVFDQAADDELACSSFTLCIHEAAMAAPWQLVHTRNGSLLVVFCKACGFFSSSH